MATYPFAASAQLLTSAEQWVDDIKADRAVDGTGYVRVFYPAKKHQFALRHTLNATDLATFRSFYDTNRGLTWTLTWGGDGNTYTCVFSSGVKVTYLGNGLANVEATALEQ